MVQAVVAEGATVPFDRVKHLHQLRSELLRLGRLPPLPTTTTQTERIGAVTGRLVGRVIEVEGVLGLWRGFLPQIISYFPTQAITFSLRDYFAMRLSAFVQQWTGISDSSDGDSQHGAYNRRQPPGTDAVRVGLWFSVRVAAGALAGATSLLILYPLHFASVQLLADVGRPGRNGVEYQFASTLDVWRQAVARSGYAGLYHGLGVSLAGMVLFRGLYFGAYDLAMYLLPAKYKKHDWICFLTGLCVTIASAFVAYPIDTVRRRIMVAALTPQAYTGVMECVREVWQAEGLQGFYAGAIANVLVCSVAPLVYLACEALRQDL